MSTDDRIEKLPRWAQGHISALERRATDAEAALSEARDAQPESDIWIEQGLTAADRQYIPDPFGHQRVVFRLERMTEQRQEPLIAVGIRGGALEVMAIGYPHSLFIKPQASNVVSVGVTR